MEKIKLKGLEEEVLVYKHKCGLTTYMWVNENVNSFYCSLNVKYGSINLNFKKDNKLYKVPYGTAHFLEHIKFNIDEKTSAHDIFNKIGGDANAFTTFKYTSYLVFANQNLKENLATLLKFVFNPFFTKKIIQKEKGIIIEESKMIQDDPSAETYYLFLKNIFNKANYRYFITGKEEDIKSITIDDIKNVYDTFYHPKNSFLCVTGNINPYEVVKTVDNVLKEISLSEYEPVENIYPKEESKLNKKYQVVERNVATTKVRFGVKILIKDLLKKYDKVTLQLILGLIISSNFGVTSEFKDKLISDEIATYFYTYGDIYDDYFILNVVADTEYPEEFLKRLNEKLDKLELDKKSIDRKRKAILAVMILNFDNVEAIATKMCDDIIQNGKIVDNEKEILEKLTFVEIKDVYEKFDTSQRMTLIVNPKNKHKKSI